MARLTRNAEKSLAELPAPLQDKAKNIIDGLDTDPSIGKKLLGKLAGKRSVRLGRTHRIIYVTEPDVCVIAIVARKDAYR